MEKGKKEICKILCGRTECNSNVNTCDGKCNKRCKTIKKSFIENMNVSQVNYSIAELQQNIFLKACPGSGKTEVLAIKVAYEKEKWKLDHQGFAVLTFTNSAENEIKSRIGCYLNKNLEYPHYVGTFTSWLHGYVANPFLHKLIDYKGDENGDKSIRLIENNCNSDFLNAYSSQYGYRELGNIKAHEFYWNFKTDTYDYCGLRNRNGNNILHELIQQDGWRERDLEKVKQSFWKSGFGLYEDIEYMTCLLLTRYPEIAQLIAQRFPIIFVDECQDLSYVQLEILTFLSKKGCKMHLIGDLNQAIYGFRDIQPEDTEEFIEKVNFKTMMLNENYRSCQQIVDVSEYVVKGKNKIVGKNDNKMNSPLLAILYTKENEKMAIEKFHEYVEKEKLSKKESRIIVRNNSLKNKLLGIKNQKQSFNNLEEIAQIIYLLNKENEASDFKKIFEILAKSVQTIFFKTSEHLNSSFFYKPKELEMTEWKKMLLVIRNILREADQLNDFTLTWSKWKDRLNILMQEKICSLEFLSGCTYSLGTIRKGNKDKKVEETLFVEETGNLYYPIETIHGCKGMSLDAIFFMSAYQASQDEHSGGYWKQWFNRENIGEENRLAYVAFSRARYLLAIGVPKPRTFSETDKKILEDAGFEIV